ncbi:hypothetical protein TNCT_483141, partial [Trichonephila clavata]
LEETIKNCIEIANNISANNYENIEFETATGCEIESDHSILDYQQNITAISSEVKENRCLKKISPFTLRSTISEPLEPNSENSSATPVVQRSKYVFYVDNGKKFIIDNADFEEDAKELIDIFNSNSTLLHNKPNSEFFENRSYNDACHFHPISMNASSENHIDEDVNENIVEFQTDKEVKEISTDYHTDEDEKGNTVDYHTNEEGKVIHSNYHTDEDKKEITSNCHTDKDKKEEIADHHVDEDVKENVDSSQKKNIFRKMKSFFKKVQKDKRIGVSIKD